jgi:enamine deaminase RidA (YjgF/YER057c/UK114 family)
MKLQTYYIYHGFEIKTLTQSLIKIRLLCSEGERIVRIAAYTFPECEAELALFTKEVTLMLDVLGMSKIPFVTIYQQPADNNKYVFDILTVKDVQSVRYGLEDNGTRTTEIETSGGTFLYTHSPNAYYNFKTNKVHPEIAFRAIEEVLIEHQITFDDVVRQWSYIDNILQIENGSQGYQAFNEARSRVFKKTNFTNGFPAATGIGASGGGVFIEAIALSSFTSKLTIKSFHNPLQAEAFTYSQALLEPHKEIATKSPPLFVRGKSVQEKDIETIFVSGTASIIGEKTAYEDNFEGQLRTTFTLIDKLIETNSMDIKSRIKVADNFRVYLKRSEYAPLAKQVCGELFPNSPIVFLIADVCRNNLLVEIERTVSYKN